MKCEARKVLYMGGVSGWTGEEGGRVAAMCFVYNGGKKGERIKIFYVQYFGGSDWPTVFCKHLVALRSQCRPSSGM